MREWVYAVSFTHTHTSMGFCCEFHTYTREWDFFIYFHDFVLVKKKKKKKPEANSGVTLDI